MGQQSLTRLQITGQGAREIAANPLNDHLESMRLPGGYLWPSLRVGRRAEIEQQYDWDAYINQLGRENQRRGHALPLGQIGVHYITDTEFRGMLIDKYPAIKRDPNAAKKIYSATYRDIKGYIEDRKYEQDKADRVKYYSPRPELMGTALLGDASNHVHKGSASWHDGRFRISPDEPLAGYDGNVIGVDLSQHREFYDERAGVIRFLARHEKLNTKPIRRDWSAHATIFHYHAHLSFDTVGFSTPNQAEVPFDVHLEAPQVFLER